MQHELSAPTIKVPTNRSQLGVHWFDGSYRIQLDDLNQYLRELTNCAESQFLAIGARLRDFRGRAAEVSKRAQSTPGTLTGEKPAELQDRLEVLLRRLDQHLQQTMSRAEEGNHLLGTLLKRLNELPESLARYSDISKTLHFLGISTLIESSGLDSNEGFQQLGNALKDLEQAMLAKVDKISHRLDSLAGLCRNVRRESEVHNSSRLILMGQSDTLTRSLLAAAAQKNQLAAKMTKSLAMRSDSVASRIGEIVSSMQFHDITRQQIDHVRDALANFADGLKQKTHVVSLDRQSAQVQVLGEACRLQAAHLRHAGDELTSAVTRIIGSLRGISADVAATAADCQLAAGSVEHEGRSLFVELDTALTNVSEALVLEILTGQKTESAIETVLEEAAQMAELIEDINRIGVEVKVIALNAGINAFHSNGNCPALAVTASEIQQLAERVFSQTTSLMADLTQITDIARGLDSAAVPMTEHPTEQVLDLSQEAAELLRLLRQLNSKSVDRLNWMESCSHDLATEIEQAIAAVTLHETSPLVIAKVVQGLDEISKKADAHPHASKKPADDSYLQSLREQYTMQSERDIYSSTQNNEGGDDDSASRPPTPLDDNIEIF